MRLLYGVAGALIACICHAQTVTTLANLGEFAGPIMQASDGNFYGTTTDDGANQSGTVFKVTPAGQVTTIFNFGSPSSVIVFPAGLLTQAANGLLYGVTASGDSENSGVVYQVSTAGAYEAIFNSLDPNFGTYPLGPLTQGKDGNLYGVMSRMGPNGFGTIFKLTLPNTLTVLHSFSGTDGASPAAGLLLTSDGNFYGATAGGGTPGCTLPPPSQVTGCGTVFQIAPDGTFTTIYVFSAANPSSPGADGSDPVGELVQGADGNFYGVTRNGGAFDSGTVFKLTPQGVLTTLYSFSGGDDGKSPHRGLLLASDGNFYGVTFEGGANGYGVIFSIAPAGKFQMLYSPANDPKNGPPTLEGPLIQASDGNLYSSLYFGVTVSTLFRLAVPSLNVPAIAPSNGVLNGASFQPGISSGAWFSIQGLNLATKADTWTIVKGALPTILDGVSVSVGGEAAYIEYVSPAQINALAPNVPAGNVAVTVSNANGISSAVNAQFAAETPAFFQWGNYAVATHQDYTYAVKNGTFAGTTTVPAKPGDVIILWGSGFGPTSPAAPAGMQTPPSTTYNTATSVSVTIGGKPVTVYGAALASGYAGLYQIAIQIPAGLGNGDFPVIATIDGAQSPSTTLITVQE